MTPEERQLIADLFDRMRGFSLPEKDREAEATINQQVAGLPDAPYMLVQSVLMQEQALQQADSRIKDLEEQVRTLQSAQGQRAPGSFLGGFFGNRAAPEPDRQPERGVSVPAVGARATPSVYGGGPAWAASPAASQPAAASAAAPQAAGGSFLKSAMATAAGVAGGVLAANAISSWLGGSSAHASAPAAQQAQGADAAPAADGAGGAAPGGEGYQEAAHQDDGDWFGGGSDEFDI